MLKLTRLLASNQIMRLDFMKFASLIKMPSLSPTMSEGGIVEWHKNEGDKVAAGDLICDIQTDKAVVGMEAEEDGILAKIIKPKDSQNIQIGEIIGLLADVGEDWKSVKIPSGVQEEKKVASKPESILIEEKTSKSPEKLGPAVRRLLDTYGLKSETIDHSGPHSILTKSDVLHHIDKSKLDPLPTAKTPSGPSGKLKSSAPVTSYTDIPLSNMRNTIAKRLSASKSSIPHFYSTGEASISKLIRIRNELKSKGVLLSLNDFVLKSVSLALRLVPQVNNGLNADGSIKVNPTVDISVAVASDSGLITPIVFNADKLVIDDINKELQALVVKARNNKLQPHEFMGGTFTVSNLGMFGIKEFTAIINPPQSAILAVGAGIPEMAFDAANPRRPRLETKMRFTLCADARVVDDISAAEFLKHVKSYLENPDFLLPDSNSENLRQAWSY